VFELSVAHPGLPKGTYTLVMRAVDPLPNGKPLAFANQAQGATLPGWLTLGSIVISSPPAS
jgi:hypothetical protein